MKITKRLSLLVLIAIGLILSIYRISNVESNEISKDVLAYYLPLPATFIYEDPLLENIDWLKKINVELNLSGSLDTVISTEKGESMYFFLFGMSLFFLPFFWMGQLFAYLLNFPIDGFSPPYQYVMVIGGIIYTLIGLYYLRKNLRHFFTEKMVVLLMLMIVFSTNFIHYSTLRDLETVNVLFMLVNIILWNTIRWHEDQKLKNLLSIGVSITLMILVKPSEFIIILLPLLWNIYSKERLEKTNLIVKYKKQFFITIGVCLVLVIPQLSYWYIKTGSIFYDSNKNPGIGFNLYSPHIIEVLFSYRKGWLVYTPIMLFALLGLYFTYKQNRKIFFAIFAYFISSLYIISCWSQWWYGDAYSCSSLIAIYPMFAISIGYFLKYIQTRPLPVKYFIVTLIIFFTFLNQFQWCQFKNTILNPFRTTKAYYWATFLKSSVLEEDNKLLLVSREFIGKMEFKDKLNYRSILIQDLKFEEPKKDEVVFTDENGNKYLHINKDQEYALTKEYLYCRLSDKDHLWVVVNFMMRFPNNFKGPLPCFVITMDRKEGNYAYYAPDIKPDTLTDGWKSYKFEYLTPEIRDGEDRLKVFIWNRAKDSLNIDNFKMEIFEKISN